MASKNTQPNLWIILVLVVTLTCADFGYGHNYGQGVPTWISLGLKSPFIQFRSEFEVLSNNSISLNLTEIRHKLKSVQNWDHFIRPVENGRKDDGKKQLLTGLSASAGVVNTFSSNMTITFLTTTPPSFVNHFEITTENSLTNDVEMDKKAFSEHMISDDSSKKDRKYIIPLALKTSSNEKEKTSTIFHGSSTNIDDLKRHILMLQNLTQSDKSFQSKFVVFPSLSKNGSEPVSTTMPSTTTTTTKMTPPSTTTTYRPPYHQMPVLQIREDQNSPKVLPEKFTRLRPTINMPRQILPNSHDILSDNKDDMFKMEKITIVPQVFLQNDQTPDSVPDEENNNNNYGHNNERKKEIKGNDGESIKNKKPLPAIYRGKEGSGEEISNKSPLSVGIPPGRRNGRNRTSSMVTAASASSTLQTAIAAEEAEFDSTPTRGGSGSSTAKIRGNGKKRNRKNKKPTEKPIKSIPVQAFDGLSSQSSSTNKTKAGRKGAKRLQRLQQKAFMLQQLTSSSSTVIPPPSSSASFTSYDASSSGGMNGMNRKLSRFRRAPQYRSLSSEFNFPKDSTIVPIYGSLNGSSVSAIGNSLSIRNGTAFAIDGTNNGGNHSEKDIINLDPDLCYKVTGLSGGQQKLCAQHVSVMPAISRGARAAIQECKHQFRHRRWNCSTIEDYTVFGPVSNIGL
ncbi:protein Wnt-5-like [Uranotaenia lowii]|uniref:protein Wnt-5-like n=1 Tax=Uranotaenia lowii TaxID=190385 RepID=UPI00247B2319|nr:protein Wnt-5-like [Uranotaenia lowii]